MSPDSVLIPADEHNQRLRKNVRPKDWVNPTPRPRYNLVVIGGGTAGLVTAAGAAGLGAQVALVERNLLGGDCLNVGCVPSKALLRASRAAADVRRAADYGVEVPPGTRVRFAEVMTRMRRLRAGLSPHDSARRFRELGVDVFFGDAQFAGSDSIVVDGATLRFSKAVIATGSRPRDASIPGLQEVGFYTNETIFSLTELPPRLAVIGAGPIGCEMAQAFARFGSEVFLIESEHGILSHDDREGAALVQHALEADGIKILCCGKQLRVDRMNDQTRLQLESHEQKHELFVDVILAGVGRAPNVEGMNLETAGIAYDDQGIQVNDRLRTTNRRVYAAGDVCSKYKFTHAADAMARIVIQNALFPSRASVKKLTIPWCTYTEPEIAHVGLSEAEARERYGEIQTYEQPLSGVDRAVLDGETEGFVKVHVRPGRGRILGATIVARHAGDLITQCTQAMVGGRGLSALSRTIHPYPTQSDGVRKVADAYQRDRLKPWIKWLLDRWFAWTR